MRRRGFTLIELLIAVSIATMMTGLVTGAVFQIRSMTQRVTARLAMASRTALVHAQLSQRLTAAAPSQAMVMEWRGGHLRLVFMRGILDNNEWNQIADSIDNGTNSEYAFWPTIGGDLVWEMWDWSRDDHVLRAATARPMRKIHLDGQTIGGCTYNDTRFTTVPQPHRTLAAATWRSELNRNLLFPDFSTTAPGGLEDRRGLVEDDIGDWTELSDRLVPVLAGEAADRQDPADPRTADGVVDFALRLELLDGTIHELTPDSPDTTVVLNGSRCDGLGGSRPVLLRLCWTLRDRRTGLSMPFSTSIPFPALGAGR